MAGPNGCGALSSPAPKSKIATFAPHSNSERENCRPNWPKPPVTTTTLFSMSKRLLGNVLHSDRKKIWHQVKFLRALAVCVRLILQDALEHVAYLPHGALPSGYLRLVRRHRNHIRMSIADNYRQTHRQQASQVINIVPDKSHLVQRKPQLPDNAFQGNSFILASLHAAHAQFSAPKPDNRIDFARYDDGLNSQSF